MLTSKLLSTTTISFLLFLGVAACDGADHKLGGDSLAQNNGAGATGGSAGSSSAGGASGIAGTTGCSPTAEVCDGIDNNCNGVVDEDLDGMLCGDFSLQACIAGQCVLMGSTGGTGGTGTGGSAGQSGGTGGVATGGSAGQTGGTAGTGACVPTGAEVCDGIDNNCDGVVDDGLDDILCGDFAAMKCVNGQCVLIGSTGGTGGTGGNGTGGASTGGSAGQSGGAAGTGTGGSAGQTGGTGGASTGGSAGQSGGAAGTGTGGSNTCIATGVEQCDGIDNDCNGVVDDDPNGMLCGDFVPMACINGQCVMQ